MFSNSILCSCSRIIYRGWNWISQRIYSLCCATQSDDLDTALSYDPYNLTDDKQVIIELLHEYDD